MPRMTQAEVDAYQRRQIASAVAKGFGSEQSHAADAGPESRLRLNVITRLREHGYLVFCGTTARATGRTEGEPDIIAVGPTRVLFLELKSAGGKLRPAQQAVGTVLIGMGKEFHVVRSVAQLEEILK